MDDKTLYTLFVQGDMTAFETLVLRHREGLIRFLTSYVDSPETAEDLSQDVFACLILRPDSYDPRYGFRTFLYTLGKRRAIDWHRRNSRRGLQGELSPDIPDGAPSPARHVEGREEKEQVATAISRLSPRYRRILYLCAVENMPLADAAQCMEITAGTAKVLLHRARKALEKQFAERRRDK